MTGFEEIRLGDLGRTLDVRRGFPTHRATPDGEVHVMSVAALRSHSAPKHFADREVISELGLGLAMPGDVLIAIEGATVGETLVVPEDIVEFVPSQQVATLRVLEDTELDPWYLGAWLSTDQAREQIRRLARGAGIQRVPMKDLMSLPLQVPPLAIQRDIGRRFVAFETAIQSHRSVAACLENLRDLDLVVTFADTSTSMQTRQQKPTPQGSPR